MKKLLCTLCVVTLMIALLSVPLSASASSSDAVYLQAEQKLSTRNGPGTQYRETGTFDLRNEYIKVLSREWDVGNVCWVECEFQYRGKLIRVYTGLKRFDCADPSRIPSASPLYYTAKAIETVKALYGPGSSYLAYDQLYMDRGQTVDLLRVEGSYAQVEWTTSIQTYRVWVPLSAVDCSAL